MLRKMHKSQKLKFLVSAWLPIWQLRYATLYKATQFKIHKCSVVHAHDVQDQRYPSVHVHKVQGQRYKKSLCTRKSCPKCVDKL